MHLPSHHFPSHTSFKGRPILTPHAHTLIESLSGDCLVASRCLLMFRQDSWSLHLIVLSLPASLAHVRAPISLDFFLLFFPSCASFSQLSLSLSLSLSASLFRYSSLTFLYFKLFLFETLSLSNTRTRTQTQTHIHRDRQTDRQRRRHIRITERVLKAV